MILIVDSGSTKTDWISVDNDGKILFSTQTLGLNPQVLSSAILKERIINNFDLYQNREEVTHLYFMEQVVELNHHNSEFVKYLMKFSIKLTFQ